MPPTSGGQVAAGSTGALGAFGSVWQGIQQQRADAAQAQEFVQQSQAIGTQTGAAIAANDAKANDLEAASRAVSGASGVTEGGSGAIVRAEGTSRAIMNDAYTRYSGKLAQSQALYQAATLKWQGSQAMGAGIIGGATQLTSGLATAAMMG